MLGIGLGAIHWARTLMRDHDMIEAIQNCVRQASIPLEEAIRMATVYPAEVAKLTDLGSIEVGKRACLVELNPSLEVVQVWYDGKALLN